MKEEWMRVTLLSLLIAGAAPASAQDMRPLPDEGGTAAAPADAAQAAPVAPDEAALFAAFIQTLRARALAEGVRPETFDREIIGLSFDPRVIRADRGQPGGGATGNNPGPLNFSPYRASHVDAPHINKGRVLYQSLGGNLAKIEKETGVAGKVALSIFGEETGYGSFSGRYDILRSFATLAYEGRRRELFTAEFIATLKLIDKGFTRAELKGSWAGATGYPQFLPSTYLRLAIDGDGDGKADIWSNSSDALASIAAYLNEAGWKPGTPWGVAAMVPSTFDRDSVKTPLVSPRCPRVHSRLSRWLTIAEWKAKGIIVAGFPAPADNEQASLIEPDGPGLTAYLLTSNYRVILDYNCSNFYALAVGLLADEVARPAPPPPPPPPPPQLPVSLPALLPGAGATG
jgi:lytic murein transglycosylase